MSEDNNWNWNVETRYNLFTQKLGFTGPCCNVLFLFCFIPGKSTDETMAESTSPKGTSGDFAKKVQRQLSRGKEKVDTISYFLLQ